MINLYIHTYTYNYECIVPDQQLFERVSEVFLGYHGEGTVIRILLSGAAS